MLCSPLSPPDRAVLAGSPRPSTKSDFHREAFVSKATLLADVDHTNHSAVEANTCCYTQKLVQSPNICGRAQQHTNPSTRAKAYRCSE